jgi:hypothetical protein
MFQEDELHFTSAMLSQRLADVLEGEDVGNGTPVAAALATALSLDLRMSRCGKAGMDRLLGLTDIEIYDLAAEFAWTFKTKGASFDLPLGTKVEARSSGEVRFGAETWVLDAGRPGLHPMEVTRRDAHGPNLRLLHHHIEQLTRRLACRRIGLPSPVFIVDNDDRHLLHFPSFAPAGGVVLERWANGTDSPRFCAALPAQILEMAKSIVADMRVLWKRRKDIGARVDKVRPVVEASAVANGVKVQLIAVDLSHQHDTDQFDLYVHFEAVDEAMRIGPVLDFIPAFNDSTLNPYRPPYGVDGRREELVKLQALSAHGRITDMAASLAKAAPAGLLAVFAELANGYESTFELPTVSDPLYATLFWKDGVIGAEVTMAQKLDHVRDELTIENFVLPDTVLTSLHGRPVSSFAELPFQCDCVVSSAEVRGNSVRLMLESTKRLVNLENGRIWDDPA